MPPEIPPDLIAFLVRNVLASWVVNTEFAAPVLIWVFAFHHRKRHPELSRFIKWPVGFLLVAGLARQVYEQFLVPWALVTGAAEPGGFAVLAVEIVFAAALFVGYGGLVWAVYYKRLVPTDGDPFATSGSAGGEPGEGETGPRGQ